LPFGKSVNPSSSHFSDPIFLTSFYPVGDLRQGSKSEKWGQKDEKRIVIFAARSAASRNQKPENSGFAQRRRVRREGTFLIFSFLRPAVVQIRRIAHSRQSF